MATKANNFDNKIRTYDPKDFGRDEEKRHTAYLLRRDDSDQYFLSYVKPRLDRSYKLYVASNIDRAQLIDEWQSNISVPYILGVVETMKPRILDARPEFTVIGRNEIDEERAETSQDYLDYSWERAKLDDESEDLVSAAMIYGEGFWRTYWKKDVRKLKFLKGRDITTKKKVYSERDVTLFDGPMAYCVDNYDMRYDWRNVPHESKQWFQERMVLNGAEIKVLFPDADESRLEMALASSTGDLTDYGSVRLETKQTHTRTSKGSDRRGRRNSFRSVGEMTDRYQQTGDPDLKFHEVRLEFRPYEDEWSVRVNDVPILDDGYQPNPYDHKEDPYIHVPFLRIPFEYEGMGYPLLLEQPQASLNHIKNQRFDAVTMSIHGMWVVNPMASIKKDQLVVRPMGIIYSPDPNGVREIKATPPNDSAYREEEMLKADMRYASGVDDLSMGVGGTVGSATESRHLRESTIERVRLFINHLGSGYSKTMRQFLSMGAQFMTSAVKTRITDDQGNVEYRLIERDDIKGEFDLKASVLPSIAGQSDIDKTQGMDLFQLLINFPDIVDPKKLISKVIHPWHWSLSSIAAAPPEQQPMMPGMEGQMPPGQPGQPMPPGQSQTAQPPQGAAQQIMQGSPMSPQGAIRPEVMQQALAMLGGPAEAAGMSPFAEASAPLPGGEAPPPTAPQIPNAGGFNRTGKVNLNGAPGSDRGNKDGTTKLLNRANSPQRKK